MLSHVLELNQDGPAVIKSKKLREGFDDTRKLGFVVHVFGGMEDPMLLTR